MPQGENFQAQGQAHTKQSVHLVRSIKLTEIEKKLELKALLDLKKLAYHKKPTKLYCKLYSYSEGLGNASHWEESNLEQVRNELEKSVRPEEGGPTRRSFQFAKIW